MIIRAFCVDGPCQGLNYIDAKTGRVLFSPARAGKWCVYQIKHDQRIDSYPVAYFDRLDKPERPRSAEEAG